MRFEDFLRRRLAYGAPERVEERTRRSYFHRLCPAAPRKYSGAKYVNERNTSCKSEGTSKAKASYLQLDIVPVETKKESTGGRRGKVPQEKGGWAREGREGGKKKKRAGKLSRSF